MGTVSYLHRSNFSVGELVRHNKFGYRGVVFDVDATFQLSDAWYDAVARSRPPKDQPWYHVLVDGAGDTTYVAERHLVADHLMEPVRHPMVETLFTGFDGQRYQRRGTSQ